jgi:hypothetical protein
VTSQTRKSVFHRATAVNQCCSSHPQRATSCGRAAKAAVNRKIPMNENRKKPRNRPQRAGMRERK